MLDEDRPQRALGRTLAWGRQQGVDDLHLVVLADPGVPARRARLLTSPVTVWTVADRSLVAAEPAPPPSAPRPDPAALARAPLLEAAGADVVVEHGVVAGEVLGLEVARVVVHESGVRIETGVGRHDREAFAMIHGDLPTERALATVIGEVRRHRTPDGPSHPLRSLAAERWLRERLLVEPALAGAKVLERADGPEPRVSVKEPLPAVAIGRALDGAPVVAVTSVGIDLELVPYAADARAMHDPDARLVLVVPARDAHPVTLALAAAALPPAAVVSVEGDWRRSA